LPWHKVELSEEEEEANKAGHKEDKIGAIMK
jgi:hypothetical protein